MCIDIYVYSGAKTIDCARSISISKFFSLGFKSVTNREIVTLTAGNGSLIGSTSDA